MRGTIIKNEGKRGNTYTVMVDVGTESRKQKKMTFKNKKEAERWLNDTVATLSKGTYVEPTKTTLGEYLKKWLDTYGKQNLAASTLESYENIVNKHLIPALGGIPLQKLLPAHLQDYYSKALKEGRIDSKKSMGRALSPTTVLFHHRVLREALDHALKSGLISRNVADAVKPPRKVKHDIKVLDEENIPKLLDLFKDSYLYMPIYLAVMTGMRAGEILALRWENIDMKEGIINISQSLRQRKVGQPEFQQPKTAGSRRTNGIIPFSGKDSKGT